MSPKRNWRTIGGGLSGWVMPLRPGPPGLPGPGPAGDCGPAAAAARRRPGGGLGSGAAGPAAGALTGAAGRKAVAPSARHRVSAPGRLPLGDWGSRPAAPPEGVRRDWTTARWIALSHAPRRVPDSARNPGGPAANLSEHAQPQWQHRQKIARRLYGYDGQTSRNNSGVACGRTQQAHWSLTDLET